MIPRHMRPERNADFSFTVTTGGTEKDPAEKSLMAAYEHTSV